MLGDRTCYLWGSWDGQGILTCFSNTLWDMCLEEQSYLCQELSFEWAEPLGEGKWNLFKDAQREVDLWDKVSKNLNVMSRSLCIIQRRPAEGVTVPSTGLDLLGRQLLFLITKMPPPCSLTCGNWIQMCSLNIAQRHPDRAQWGDNSQQKSPLPSHVSVCCRHCPSVFF